jgi:energy-coupling factor transporter transmembrane protein EcfT
VCVCISVFFYFYRGAEQVVMQMTSKGINPFSAPRTPVPLTQFNKQAAGAEMKNIRVAQQLAKGSIFAEQL